MPKAKIPHLKLAEIRLGGLGDKDKKYRVLEVRNSVDWSVGQIVEKAEVSGLLRVGKITTALVPTPKGGVA